MRIQNGGLYLFNLAVAPKARNQGIASLLLKEAEAIARWLGINLLFLHVDPIQDLLTFYQKKGFQNVEIENLGDRTAFKMVKIIAF